MTKHLKKLALFLLTAVMLLAGTVTAYAADSEENPYIETIRGASVMGSSPVIFRDTSTGMPAYCIDYNRGVPDPESLSGEFDPMTIFDPDTYRGLEYLLLAGYPFESGGLSDTEAQACTQLAVWCWTGETLGYGLNSDNYQATNGRDDIYEYFIGLMEAARNQTPPDIGIDCDDIEMKIDGDTMTGTAAVTIRNLNGYGIDESVLPDGIAVTGYTGESGDVLVFTAALDYAGKTASIENLLTGQDTRSALNLFWYDNSNPNQQRMVISYYDETSIAVAAGVTLRFEEIPEPEYGYIKLTKSASDTQSPLAGAVFGVYDAATDEKLGELSTGTDGTAVIKLPVGGVYLLEQTASEGYNLSGERIEVTITGGETVTVTAVNEPIPTPDPDPAEGKIKLIKKDDDNGNLLANTIFGVYRVSDDVKACEIETNSHGEAVSPLLPMGGYYLKELKAPDSYELSSEKYGVTVKANETVEITVTNKKIPTPDPESTEGKIKLIKKDKADGKLLATAVFGVYRASDDVKVCELETNSRGEAVSPLLPKGDYYLKELAAPDNYELSSEKTGVTVKADETVEITVTNKKTPTPDPDPTEGRIKLIKKDKDDSKLLANAVFGVYRVSDDVKVCEMETTSRGEAVSPLLPEGKYYLKELKAPDNYELSSKKYGVTVKADKTAEITITNKKTPAPEPTPNPTPTPTPNSTPTPTDPTPAPKPSEPTGELVLLKKAEQTGNPLAGAVFGVYRVSDDVKVGELTTKTDGKAALSLAAGDYYLKELKAPYGFLLEKAKIFFTVVKDSTVTVEVTNQRDETIADPEPIEVPKTGESVPCTNYIVGGCLLILSAILGGVLYNKKRKRVV